VPAASVEVDGLVVRYGPRVAVSGLSFRAHAGEVVTLLGPNGAGKTSTVEVLEGYRSPAGGTALVLGLDPRRDHAALTRRLGVMLQQGGVYPGMSAAEALRLFAAFYADPLDPDALLHELRLAPVAATPWRRLSGGEQRRLSLALALVGRPEVAILDEPTAGVDLEGRLTIRRVVADLRARGVCVLMTTHELEEAERLADRVVIVDHGRAVATGTPAELMTATARRDIRFGAPPDLDAGSLAAHLGADVREEQPGEYVVAAEATPGRVAALTAWLAERDLPLADLRAGRERLEDVFLRLTAADEATAPEHANEASAPEHANEASASGPARRGRRR